MREVFIALACFQADVVEAGSSPKNEDLCSDVLNGATSAESVRWFPRLYIHKDSVEIWRLSGSWYAVSDSEHLCKVSDRLIKVLQFVPVFVLESPC